MDVVVVDDVDDDAVVAWTVAEILTVVQMYLMYFVITNADCPLKKINNIKIYFSKIIIF